MTSTDTSSPRSPPPSAGVSAEIDNRDDDVWLRTQVSRAAKTSPNK